MRLSRGRFFLSLTILTASVCLALGITIATVFSPNLIDLGATVFGDEDAWRMAFRRGLNPSTAADVCEVVRDHALPYFNDVDEAKELLAEWGIRASEDLGRIVYALVDAGMLRAEPNNSVRDFDGLFRLETLLAEGGR